VVMLLFAGTLPTTFNKMHRLSCSALSFQRISSQLYLTSLHAPLRATRSLGIAMWDQCSDSSTISSAVEELTAREIHVDVDVDPAGMICWPEVSGCAWFTASRVI